jgi:hypothetical protein
MVTMEKVALSFLTLLTSITSHALLSHIAPEHIDGTA